MKNSLFNSLRKLTIFFILLFFTLSGFATKVTLIYSESALVVSSKIILCTVKDDTSNTIIEENTTAFYVNPNTNIVGVDYINLNTKLLKQEKEQPHLYIVKNTIFFHSQDLVTVTIKRCDEFQNFSKNNRSIVSKKNVTKNNEQVIRSQSKTQVSKTPFPFSLPINKKTQTIVSTISVITATPSTFSKTVNQAFAVHDCFSLAIRKMHYQKQNTIYNDKKSKPFQVKTKHCNRPPPQFCC